MLFKIFFRPARDKSELVQGFLALSIFIINKKSRFDPDFIFILCFFWKNGNKKKPKKFSFFNHS